MLLYCTSGRPVRSEEKKTAAALIVSPLAVAVGQTAKFDVRGLNLAEATGVKLASGDKSLDAVIKTKGAVDVPNGLDVKDVGNTRVECELTLPADFPVGIATVIIGTALGEVKQALVICSASEFLLEKEPNDGFRQAQPVTIEQTVAGAIQQAKDVDVYEITATAGQKLEVAVVGPRPGSTLDAMLTVFSSRGQIIAQQDDNDAGRDPLVNFTAATAGRYFLVVQDAHDRGGLHPYILKCRPGK